MANTMATTSRHPTTSHLPSCSNLFWRGVGSIGALLIMAAILPISVSMPVPVTTNFPFPRTTVVPMKTLFRRSPKEVPVLGTYSQSLVTGWDSPVRAASSTARRWLSNSRPSAGIRCPGLRKTISPGTSSAASISCSRPSRMTIQVGAASSRRASKDRSALCS